MSTISLPLKNKPELVLFDLDGTLLDSSKGVFACIEYAFAQSGIKVDFNHEDLRSYVGNGVAFLLQKINNQLTATQLQALKSLAFTYYQTYAYSLTFAFDGVACLLTTLKEYKIDWAVVTNKTRTLTEAVLQKLPCHEQMKALICADDLTYKKPHPQPLLQVIKDCDAKVEKTLFVGDGLNDMKAAKYAGCQAVLATYGYVDDKALAYPGIIKINDLEQLKTWITYLSVPHNNCQ
ncbi:HAD family hydrolase [Facilibium subflavum]|uniref:HAD family hydrolase n=1 Tax=Facilibium subflavum TaxID=2219058 RepID=UPI0013C33F0D|nr:HAD-IA family hydrolase [Facilibium subflavum]